MTRRVRFSFNGLAQSPKGCCRIGFLTPVRQPEFNSVDASLWYVIAVHDFLRAGPAVSAADQKALRNAVEAILEGYSEGTRFGIKMDRDDGLLMAGEPGVHLTWMDAKVGDWVVTPRIGKPVEVQALWINALTIAAAFDERWASPLRLAMAAFARRFFDPAARMSL